MADELTPDQDRFVQMMTHLRANFAEVQKMPAFQGNSTAPMNALQVMTDLLDNIDKRLRAFEGKTFLTVE